jgi:hypothetical protein
MYDVRATRDKETGKPIAIYRAWIGDTKDAYEVFNTDHTSTALTGPWTYATAKEIADWMNRNEQSKRSVTDDSHTAD